MPAANPIDVRSLTLEQQVALHTERMTAFALVGRRMMDRTQLIVSREEWLAANPDAPSRKLVRGIVKQAEAQQAMDRARASALKEEVCELFEAMIQHPSFGTDYQAAILPVPGMEHLPLQIWERWPSEDKERNAVR